MGRPKLLLPLGGRTVVDRLVETLDDPRIAEIVVVARRDDTVLAAELRDKPVTLVQPEVDPPDMRASVQHALDHLGEHDRPEENDGWLLIPADHPILSRDVLNTLIEAWSRSDASILAPVHEEKRGHPTIFRWSLAQEVEALPPDCGLNVLVRSREQHLQTVEVEDASVLTDLDTPEDYDRVLEAFESSRSEPLS